MRVFSRSRYVPRRNERFMSISRGSSFRLSRTENARGRRAFSIFVPARQERVEMGLQEARGRRSLPAAIRVYHTHLDSEDGVDGLFDAREVSLAEGPQHLILADADQGLPRGLNDDDAASASSASFSVLRRVCTRHAAIEDENSATSLGHPRGIRDFACAQTHGTHAAFIAARTGSPRNGTKRYAARTFSRLYTIARSRLLARRAVFFVLSFSLFLFSLSISADS